MNYPYRKIDAVEMYRRLDESSDECAAEWADRFYIITGYSYGDLTCSVCYGSIDTHLDRGLNREGHCYGFELDMENR